MEIFVISFVALIASFLTLFSGFGLGTLLMPFVALFLPIDVAIAMTAIVHFANNIFKVGLLGREADKTVLLKFGIPAVVFAFIGALFLEYLMRASFAFEYELFGLSATVIPIKFVVGIVIVVFVILELLPKFASMSVDKKYLPIGGMISGFFGGLSGHQGAFRSMFLIKIGLSKEAFVASGVMVAVMVDSSRLLVYGNTIGSNAVSIDWIVVISATISAFVGSYFGAKILKKITVEFIRYIVSILLLLIGLLMIGGIL
ncbi:MAG: sulfite exporter TauE/SafE family protein [Sulfurimonas sp.]|nr:sulfite exporter TauE/SafE family protein [Sulfurimonas sp.]